MKLDLSPEHLETIQARRDTAREWFVEDPKTADEIADFYRYSQALPDELRAWHEEPTRASWTDTIVQLAKATNRTCVADIGCGLGHDLIALRNAGLLGWGVEPNEIMRKQLCNQGVNCIASLDASVLIAADLILLMDVLEHLHDPDTLLKTVSLRAKLGTILVEHTPTWDLADPLHLLSNYGWLTKDHLPQLGWRMIGNPADPVGVWQRV